MVGNNAENNTKRLSFLTDIILMRNYCSVNMPSGALRLIRVFHWKPYTHRGETLQQAARPECSEGWRCLMDGEVLVLGAKRGCRKGVGEGMEGKEMDS